MAIFKKKKRAGSANRDFDAAVREILTAHVPDGVIVANEDDDSIQVSGGTLNLRNMRMHWSDQDPSERYAWLEGSIIEVFSRMGSDTSSHDGILRAGVRSQATLSISNLQMSLASGFDSPSTIPMQPIGGDLVWCVVIDFPHTMQIAGRDALVERGVSFEEALETGKAQLADPIEEWAVMDGRVFSVLAEDDYTASRAFLPGALDRLPFDGDKVIFHPGRRDLMIVSADDPEGIAMAAQFVVENQEVASPISFSPVVGSDGNWQQLDVASTHPAFEACRMLTVLDGLLTYEPQQHLLMQQFDDELFVASYKAVQLDGDVMSYGVWTKGVETLLPHTDLVAIVDLETAENLMVPWLDVERVCEEMFTATNHYPRRTLVPAKPSEPMLDELRKAAINV